MLAYKAMYKYLEEGVHAEVPDFPGAITWATNLAEARQLLASGLVDMAEANLLSNYLKTLNRHQRRYQIKGSPAVSVL